MQILRFLVLASLAACTSSAFAQSLPDNNTISAKPKPYSFVPSPVLPTLQQYVFRGEQSNLLQGKILPRLTLSPAQENQPQTQTYLRLLSPNLSQNRLLFPQKNQRCYAMRSYRFNRDNPASDTTDFAEYSTCQSANDFQMKAALDTYTR